MYNQKMESSIDLDAIKNDLEQLLYKAGEGVESGYKEKAGKVQTKRDVNDLLTKYDVESDEIIIKHLKTTYPEFSIVSEESPEITKDSEYKLLVDPIDGTRNFVRNIPVFFIGVALVLKKQTLLSLTYNPITKELFHAIKGRGAFLNGEPLQVGDRELALSDVVVRTIPDKNLEKRVVSNIVEKVHQIKNNMCSHDEISGVAHNRYDGFISKNSSPWDYCHYLLIEEAGGVVTDWNGESFDISKDNIVASNGTIHYDLLRTLEGS